MRSALLVSLLSLSACAGLRDGTFSKGRLSYRVVEPGSEWSKVGFADNDLAWHKGGVVMAMNATCEGHGDASLDVLSRHLVFGFSNTELKERESRMLDGREALWSRYQAHLDGVPVELETLVLKKDGCVHDFSRVVPEGHFDQDRAAFNALIDGFHAEVKP